MDTRRPRFVKVLLGSPVQHKDCVEQDAVPRRSISAMARTYAQPILPCTGELRASAPVPAPSLHRPSGPSLFSSVALFVETKITGKNQVSLPAQGMRELGWERGDGLSVEVSGEDMLLLVRRPKSWADYFSVRWATSSAIMRMFCATWTKNGLVGSASSAVRAAQLDRALGAAN